MKIGKLQQNITFKRALTDTEKNEFRSILQQAKEQISDGGKSILIVHEPCLPQAKATDTGIGHLTSKTSSDFFDFAKNYLGINTIEVLPPGEIQFKKHKDFYNTYNGSALSLGSQCIDIELLTKPEGKSLLSNDDLFEVVQENAQKQKEGFVNYENIVGSQSKQEAVLQKAFDNYINNTTIDKKDYEKFKTENSLWLNRKALYSALQKKNGGKSWHDWDDTEKNLYVNTDPETKNKIADLEATYSKDIEFYKFKQFIAEQHLQMGRNGLHEKGMKLYGDCLIGFSEDEVWSFPKAFKYDETGKIVNIGLPEWEIPALNYDEIIKSVNDKKDYIDAHDLLKMKVKLFAKRYDGIRFDCSWSYVNPKLSDNSNYEFDGKILDIIEDTVKEEKGTEYNPNDLIHEFEADSKDFSIFEESGDIKYFLKDRVKVISSAHLDEKYGTAYAMRKLNENPDSYIIGVGNHDPQPLRQIADNIPETINGKKVYIRAKQADVLKDIFGISRKDISSPTDFSKYKFAEPLTAKNNMIFYMDVFGRSDRFDSQINNKWENYRQRIPVDYAKSYNAVLETGYGYNPMDAYAKAFKKKGLDVRFKPLYDKIIKYAKILEEKSQTT